MNTQAENTSNLNQFNPDKIPDASADVKIELPDFITKAEVNLDKPPKCKTKVRKEKACEQSSSSVMNNDLPALNTQRNHITTSTNNVPTVVLIAREFLNSLYRGD